MGSGFSLMAFCQFWTRDGPLTQEYIRVVPYFTLLLGMLGPALFLRQLDLGGRLVLLLGGYLFLLEFS